MAFSHLRRIGRLPAGYLCPEQTIHKTHENLTANPAGDPAGKAPSNPPATNSGALGCLLLLCLAACQPEGKDVAPAPGPEPANQEPGLPTEVGQPIGELTTQIIGPAGGAMRTPDGELTLRFPVGALKEATAITIQPVENKVPGPFGKKAYVFGPAGLKTAKPVEVVRHYEPEEMNGTAAEVVGFAFQDTDNTWRGRLNLQVDTTNRTLTTTVPDFDHPMGYCEQFFMIPDSATLLAGQEQKIEVWYQKGPTDKTQDVLQVPVYGVEKAERMLTHNEVRGWKVNGEAQGGGKNQSNNVSGHFAKADNGAWGTYYAPRAVPPRAYNPVAVSMELKLKNTGVIMLVSNSRIVSPGAMTIGDKKYKNVDMVASYSKEQKSFSITLAERYTGGEPSFDHLSASVNQIFTGPGTYPVRDNGTHASNTQISAFNNKNWGYADYYAKGGTIWGPASITVKEINEKFVQGTLHSTDPDDHRQLRSPVNLGRPCPNEGPADAPDVVRGGA